MSIERWGQKKNASYTKKILKQFNDWTEWLEDDEKSNSQSEFGKSTKIVNIWANRRQNRKGFVL